MLASFQVIYRRNMGAFLFIIVGLIILIVPIITLIIVFSNNSTNATTILEHQGSLPISSEIIEFRTLQIDLNLPNYYIYLLSSARWNTPVEPKRFIHPALRNSYRHYDYIIVKNGHSHNSIKTTPQFHLRVVDDGQNDLFDFTTQLITVSKKVSSTGVSSYYEHYSYYHKFYSKMHFINFSFEETKEMIKKLHNYFLQYEPLGLL